jgi:hypothetical protein
MNVQTTPRDGDYLSGTMNPTERSRMRPKTETGGDSTGPSQTLETLTGVEPRDSKPDPLLQVAERASLASFVPGQPRMGVSM